MKRKLTTIFILMLCLARFAELSGQVNSTSGEKINLFTDRAVYIVGEKVQFAAYLTANSKNNFNLSSIIYLEIISPEGEKIAKGKYIYQNNFCSGSISIPNDILTGYYYIRAYTRYLRNFGPTAYDYIRLKIINPFKPDVLPYISVNNSPTDSVLSSNKEKNYEPFALAINKKEYLTRDTANFKVDEINLKEDAIKYLNISVIPEYSYIVESNVNVSYTKSIDNQIYSSEPNGITITGNIFDSNTQKPLPNTIVNLSILGKDKDFIATLSDSLGRFFFKLPNLIGSRDIFFCSESSTEYKSTILVNNDFCNNEVKIATPPFRLNDQERNTAYNMAINSQVASLFNTTTPKDTTTTYQNKAFYGEPKIKLVLDKYIQLPTVEDYINELVPLLKIKKHHKKKYFKIFNTTSVSEMEIYKPLILLDLVAVDDVEKILSLSPQVVSYIELVDVPYIKGNITYGGIISIFSKKGDFAGIDLPSSGTFLDFNFLTDNSMSNVKENASVGKPDARNTLLWEPMVSLNKTKEFSFSTPDTPGTYIILLRGVTNKGEKFTYKQPFVVKTR